MICKIQLITCKLEFKFLNEAACCGSVPTWTHNFKMNQVFQVLLSLMNEIRLSLQPIRPSAFDIEALRRSTTNLFFRGKMQDQSNKVYYKLIKDGIVEKHSNLDSSLETINESQVELLERVIMLLQELNSMEKEKRYVFKMRCVPET